jgi:hypothetical protein
MYKILLMPGLWFSWLTLSLTTTDANLAARFVSIDRAQCVEADYELKEQFAQERIIRL